MVVFKPQDCNLRLLITSHLNSKSGSTFKVNLPKIVKDFKALRHANKISPGTTDYMIFLVTPCLKRKKLLWGNEKKIKEAE